jgi:hypothetical protein
VAHAGEHRVGIRRVAHLPAQTAAADLRHPALLVFSGRQLIPSA